MSNVTIPAFNQPIPMNRSLRVVKKNETVSFIRITAISLSLICFIFQLLIDAGGSNPICAFMIAVSSIFLVGYCVDEQKFRLHPLPMVGLVGFGFSTHIGALFATTLYWQPVNFNLQVPEQAIALCIASQLCLFLVFELYSRAAFFGSARRVFRSRIARPLGLIEAPSNAVLWTLGFIGLTTMWITNVQLRTTIEYGDVGSKFLQGFNPFYMAPFFILFSPFLLGGKPRVSKTQRLAIIGYFVIVVIVAVARNSRGVFAATLLVSGMALLICLISGQIILNKRGKIYLIVALLFAPLAFSALSNLATAMAIARSERDIVSPVELIEQTIIAFNNREAIERFENYNSGSDFSEYSELYIPNSLLTRFVQLKTIDNQLAAGITLSEDQVVELRRASAIRMLLVLPTPLMNLVDSSLRKSDYAYSSADYYYLLADGDQVGGNRVGSSVVDGWITFGALYYFIFATILFITFTVFDGLTLRSLNGQILICPAMLFSLQTASFGLANGDSVVALIVNIVREYPQLIALYVAVNLFVKFVLNYTVVFGAKPRHVR